MQNLLVFVKRSNDDLPIETITARTASTLKKYGITAKIEFADLSPITTVYNPVDMTIVTTGKSVMWIIGLDQRIWYGDRRYLLEDKLKEAIGIETHIACN